MRIKSHETLAALMRQEDYLNGQKFAQDVGCSRSFVSQLRSGKKRSCSSALAGRIAEALGVPVTTLFAPATSSDSRQNVKVETTS